MANQKLVAILKNKSAVSITLSVLVSFLFVFAFATSTTTISSTGITATGDGSFAGLSVTGITTLATTTISGNITGLILNSSSTAFNMFVGEGAGFSNTTGSNNFFGGYQSGYSNTSGVGNSFIGELAGYSNTAGSYNAFFGHHAGADNVLGGSNTLVGSHAGANSGGFANVAVGRFAMYTSVVSSGPITSFTADTVPNPDETVVHSVNHGLLGGESIVIARTSDMDGNYTVVYVDADTFKISSDGGVTNIAYTGDSAFEDSFWSVGPNTVTGYAAGGFDGPATTGHANVFNGFEAGYFNTTGSNNFFGGYQSGYSNTTGSNNLFAGYQAGYSDQAGEDNTFAGYQAGYSHRVGSHNTLLGSFAGRENIYGDQNTAMGRRAFQQSLGSENTGLGRDVGENSLGSRLTFMGAHSGNSNVYGIGDTGIGYNALFSLNPSFNDTGTISTFSSCGGICVRVTTNNVPPIGTEVAISGTTNYNGVWIIDNPQVNTFDIYIDPVGFVADDAVGNWYSFTPTNNTALGYEAGYSNITGTNNFFGGYQAGYSNTDSFNNFIGYRAGYSNVNGSDNNFIGQQSGLNNVSGSENVFIGNWAGHESIDGGNNVYLGASAGQNNVHGAGNVFIGQQAGLSELGSNRLYIANSDPGDFTTASSTALIYGEFDNALLRVNGQLQAGGNITPMADDSYDLGSLTNRWRDLYLGPASIHLGSTTISSINQDLYWGKMKITSVENKDSALQNFAQIWTPKSSRRVWSSIAVSSDGQYMTGTVKNGQIYISNDFGKTWTAAGSSLNWSGVSISTDGKYQTAVVDGGQIYTSSDYGANWTAAGSSLSWKAVSVSANGSRQTAVADSGYIYVSTDYGATWSPKDSIRAWSAVSISSDGLYQTATELGGYIYVSSDYGENWSPRDSIRSWQTVAISASGKYQTAARYIGSIYISSDYGNTWTVGLAASGVWASGSSIAISSDGSKQIAVNNYGGGSGGPIMYSSDYGNNWDFVPSPNQSLTKWWTASAISADGVYQVAVGSDDDGFTHPGNGTYVYVSVTETSNFLGAVGIGTVSPTSALDIEKIGLVKSNLDILEVTNTDNAADMDGTKTSFLFNQYYYNAVTPAVADSGRITFGTETDWTSIASTQNSYFSISTALGGLVAEKMRVTSSGHFGLGTTSPLALLTVGSSTPAYLLPTQYYNSAYVSGQLEVGGSATSTFAGYLDVLGSTAATSTYSGNLWVKGTLRAAVSYVGDLIFANNFKFYEDPMPTNRQLATGTQSLKLTNQRNEDIFSIDEDGNLTIKGQLKQSTTTEQSVISLGLSWILDQFKTIGVTIADGVMNLKSLVVSDKVCVDDICLDKSDFGGIKELLNRNGLSQQEQPAQIAPVATTPQPTIEPTSTTTSTTTEAVIPPDPAPVVVEPAPVPIPDPAPTVDTVI